MKRIGVTGAFGFLGANFVSALLEGRKLGRSGGESLEIVAFSSKASENPLFDPSAVRVESLDVLDREGLGRKFRGLDALAHFAGRVDYRPSMRRAVWETDALGTKNVFDAALAAGIPRILHVSSVCALGPGLEGDPADEGGVPYGEPSWPLSFASREDCLAAIEASAAGDFSRADGMKVAYVDAKLAGWELAKLYAREKGLPVVTIFPGTAVGAGDMHNAISKLVNLVWEGRLGLSFPGSTSFVAASDLGRGAVLALENGRAGEGYVIGGREEDNLDYAAFQDLVASLARAEGRPAKKRSLVMPKPLMLAAALAAERLLPRGSLTEAFVLSGSMRNVCTSAKARRELGYEPLASLESAILACRRFSIDMAAR